MPEKVNPVLTVTEDNKLSVTWDKVSFADGYDIFIGIDNVDDMNVVATVDSNSTSFTYNEKMYCGCYYYVEVKAYIINSAGQKVYGLSNTAFERIEIGTVSGNSYEYSVEDTVTVRWTDNNDGIYDGVFANIYYGNSFKKRVYIDKGVTSYDFDIAGATVGGSVSIDADVTIKSGTVIYPNNRIFGKTYIGNDVILYPNNIIENCYIDDNSSIEFSVVKNAEIPARSKIGPFEKIIK